jgi:hypothetical protein
MNVNYVGVVDAATRHAVVALVVTLLHAYEAAASAQVSSGSALWRTACMPLFVASLDAPRRTGRRAIPIYLMHVFPNWSVPLKSAQSRA